MTATGVQASAPDDRPPGELQAGAGGDPPERRLAWRVFGLTWLSYASYYLTRKNFAVAKKAIQRENPEISITDLGRIDSLYSVGYSAGQFLWGSVADRVGARRVLGVGMIATAVLSLAFGYASSLAMFTLLYGVNGLAQSSGWSPNVKAMSAFFGPERRGAVMGLWTTNYQIGSMAANPICGYLLGGYGWRAAFIVPAFWVAAVGVGLLVLLPERRAPSDAAALARAREEGRTERRRVLRTPLLWALGSAYFFMKLTRYVLWGWLPYYTSGLGYSDTTSAVMPIAFEVGGAIGALTIGWISDRFLTGRRVPAGIGFLFGLAAALPLFAWVAPRGPLVYILALALVGFFLFGPDALLSGAAAQDLGGPAAAATAAGVINGLGSIAQIAAGMGAAELARRAGFSLVFVLLGVGALLAAGILAPFWRSGSPPRRMRSTGTT